MTMVTADCANSFIFAATGYMPVSLTLETSYREGEILSHFDPLIIYDWGIFYGIHKINFGFKFQSKRAGVANLF